MRWTARRTLALGLSAEGSWGESETDRWTSDRYHRGLWGWPRKGVAEALSSLLLFSSVSPKHTVPVLPGGRGHPRGAQVQPDHGKPAPLSPSHPCPPPRSPGRWHVPREELLSAAPSPNRTENKAVWETG